MTISVNVGIEGMTKAGLFHISVPYVGKCLHRLQCTVVPAI